MNGMTRYALAAVAVVAVVVGGLYLLRPGTDPSVGVGGSRVTGAIGVDLRHRRHLRRRLPASPEPSVGALTQAFTSPTFGYSIRYPAGWKVTSTDVGEAPFSDGSDDFVSAAGGWYLRALSRAVPDGVVVDDWIVHTLQQSDDAGCMPRRDTQELVTVDGHEGRILGFCGAQPAPQIEATFVVDRRAYLFTLFDTQEAPSATEARALFDKIAATVKLDPQSAGGSPSPSPS